MWFGETRLQIEIAVIDTVKLEIETVKLEIETVKLETVKLEIRR